MPNQLINSQINVNKYYRFERVGVKNIIKRYQKGLALLISSRELFTRDAENIQHNWLIINNYSNSRCWFSI